MLNHPDYGFGIEENALREIVDRLNSTEIRSNLHQLLDAWTEVNEKVVTTDETTALLRTAVESSASYRYAHEASLGFR